MKTALANLKNIHWNAVYAKESKLRVRNVKFALTVLFYNLILIGIAIFGFEVAFNVNLQGQVDYSNAIGLYIVLIVIEAFMVMFLVPAYTAGSIAGEREKQTLEILLTTTLRPRQIVWGKLLSSISMVLLLIVSTLPTISIIFTIGGVGLTDLLEFVIVVFVFAILIGSIGIWGSVMIKRTVPATVFTYGGIIVLCGVTAVVVGVVWIIKNLYYYQILSVNSNASTPDISLLLLLLLFNPACTMIEMLTNQFAGESVMSELLLNSGDLLPDFVRDHWVIISLIVQMLLAIVIMRLAEKQLDPLRKRKVSKRKMRKQEKRQQKRQQKLAKKQQTRTSHQ